MDKTLLPFSNLLNKTVWLILVLFLSSGLTAQVTLDATATANGAGVGPLTWSHTCTGSNLILMVGVANLGNKNPSVTYNGVSMSQLSTKFNSSLRVSFYYLIGPSTGTHDVIVTLPGGATADMACGSMSYTGVDPGTSMGTPVTSFGEGDASNTGSITSASGELVVDFIGVNSKTISSVGGGQTVRFSSSAPGNSVNVKSSSKSGAASVSTSYGLSGDDDWVVVGVSVKAFTILPIELISFNAKLNQKVIDLNWSTASEKNNDFFTIEKSTNGSTFEIIAKKGGAGNSTTQKDYSITDEHPSEGTSYYRLKQTDYDGKFEYSYLVAVNYEKNSTGCVLKVYPNPCTSECTIDLAECDNEESPDINVELIDASGSKVYTKVPLRDEKGSFSFSFDSKNNLKPGIYIVRGVSKKENYTKKIIIK